MHYFWNQKPITTMCSFILYDKYFLSYRKKSYFGCGFQQKRQKNSYFATTQKVIIVQYSMTKHMIVIDF